MRMMRVNDELVELPIDYFLSSYAAKYWLNRYLRLTQNKKLPKNGQDTRLAVIHIRNRSTKSKVGRVMDRENLTHVAQSIAHASKTARLAKEHPFSHIILYGDFQYNEAIALKELVEKHVSKKLTREKVDVLFISGPWQSVSEGYKSMDKKIDKLWESFRSSDYIPIQVKILAIWNTLCVRYHPKICVIGHRSGFIEGAGMIGIPVFYLNNEREKIDQGEHPKAGGLLWERVAINPDQDRLRSLANVMNTIISIEALKKEATEGVLRVDKKFKNELAAALFMYMCCEYRTKFSEITPLERYPARAARVDMMHDTCEDVGYKLEFGCQDSKHVKNKTRSQTGQEWLRARYDFAINSIERRSTAKVQLPGWDKAMTDSWAHNITRCQTCDSSSPEARKEFYELPEEPGQEICSEI